MLSLDKAFGSGHGLGDVERDGGDQRGGTEKGEESSCKLHPADGVIAFLGSGEARSLVGGKKNEEEQRVSRSYIHSEG